MLLKPFSYHQVEDAKGRTCLHVSSSNGHLDMVQVLLGQGAHLNAKDKNGWIALHYAANAGYLATVKLLVDSGSSSTAETNDGHIPLWYYLLMLACSLI